MTTKGLARILLALGVLTRLVPVTTLVQAATRDTSECIPIDEAVSRGQIRFDMFATGALNPALRAVIENLTSEPLFVCFPPTLNAIPIDPQYPLAVISGMVTSFTLPPGYAIRTDLPSHFADLALPPPPAGVEYRLDVVQAPIPTATSIYHWCGIPVEEALSQGLVQVTLIANGNLFFRDPLRMDIVNLTSQELRLCLRPGLIAVPVDPQYQRIMVTEVQPFTLPANGVIPGLHFFAECIDEDLHPPEAGAEYRFEMMAEGDLLGVANAIDDREAQGRLGSQMATWAVTDEFTLDDLAGAGGSGLSSTIQPLLCLTTGEIELAHQLLEDAGTDLTLFTSENPADFCQRQGIPTLDQLRELGVRALVVVLIVLLALLAGAAGVVFLLIRLLRARR